MKLARKDLTAAAVILASFAFGQLLLAAPSRPMPPAAPERPNCFPAAAPNFIQSDATRHFVLLTEGGPPSLELLEAVENLHANLSLDLSAFASEALRQKVRVVVQRTTTTYPIEQFKLADSPGCLPAELRQVFIRETDSLSGDLAEALARIYFLSFFRGHKLPPRWVAEGYSTVSAQERGSKVYSWDKASQPKSSGVDFRNFVLGLKVPNSGGVTYERWRAQSNRFVRFLIQSQNHSSFFKFNDALRQGVSVEEALQSAYGWNGLKDVEIAWQRSLDGK